MKHIRSINPGRPLVADPTQWEWQQGAACAGEDLDLFYGHDGETDEQRDLREAKAKAICDECPLATWKACLEKALIPRPADQHGVQGGMTAYERKREKHNRQRRHAKWGRAA